MKSTKLHSTSHTPDIADVGIFKLNVTANDHNWKAFLASSSARIYTGVYIFYVRTYKAKVWTVKRIEASVSNETVKSSILN